MDTKSVVSSKKSCEKDKAPVYSEPVYSAPVYVEPEKLEGKSVQIIPIKLKAKTTFNFDFSEFLKKKNSEKEKGQSK